jgi:D-glycero-D-manno-heptose 1,7-bisphosphate phosphatase
MICEWRYCFHTREEGCDCRKPKPGMLLEAAAAHGLDLPMSWVVGDTDADLGAGRAAGCRTVLIEHPGSAHKRTVDAVPDARARNLLAAAAFLG